ncbi:nucleotidyltransferase family protein [Candidatus Nitrosotenuis cloacae]|uniref:Nucleoside-diphosphate-sugar pyrophosphorylase n=1 Tax=Candidatus Nitrosotenuis cloacae TaxID=1603555 RepID=A0A3G1B125_9ARCH|nr:nucleotidyltransferase family protein [Candidatus Nitrosotenuis cloacae]AJZ75342.1 nucleoside-diphosphate-sugar pyrophosphorylase [Candidatus Nitrosotenuis cloacae]
MQAIILAGGLGSRLKPITDYVPKPLIPINNIPLIEYQIKQLKKFRVNQFVICTGYKTDQIQNYLEHKKNFDSKILYSIEKTPLGTGGAIKKAAKLIKDKSFLVLNGDIISTIDVQKLYPHKNSIALVELRTKFGTVELDDSMITRFQEKKPLTNIWMNSGIYHLSKDIIPHLPSKGAIEDTTFRKFAKEGKLVGIRFKNAFWHSIDSHKDLDDCSKALKGKKL